jgi:hypothetical protein
MGNEWARLDLCNASDLVTVALSGPCATGDASPANYVRPQAPESVVIGSASAGVCHVELVFGSGFTYSTDITFVLQTPGSADPSCPPCGPYTQPTVSVYVVDNPGAACVDAGVSK